jgi:predicted RNA-binding protein associated with RNAse of E/G family
VDSTADIVHIHYRRPPDREELFDQAVVLRTPDCVITLLEHASLSRPMVIGNRTVLEPGAPAVWFTFPGRWHDIGRFHLIDGTFTGLYANILTPVRFIAAERWETTDLFLDVWVAEGGATVLDVEELTSAVRQGWIRPEVAARARAEAAGIAERAASGSWPPRLVWEWPLDRARAATGARSGTRAPRPV